MATVEVRTEVGVHSEVGTLRSVMVCRPGLAHQRLTPGNRAELLFDDVLWVHEAQKDHYDFVLKMKKRGVEVLAGAGADRHPCGRGEAAHHARRSCRLRLLHRHRLRV